MAIIYVNGEPIEVEDNTQTNQQPDECPPGGLPEGEEPGDAGDEAYAEYNFSDLNFLAPIDTVDFENENSAQIRKINILDEYSFFRSPTNIFITNDDGNHILGNPNLYSNNYSSLYFKSLGVSDSSTTRRRDMSGQYLYSFRNGKSDKFRILNNRLWALDGTEQAPIRVVFLDNHVISNRSERTDYTVDSNSLEGQSKFKLNFTNGDANLPDDISEREQFIEDQVSKIIEFGQKLEDICTAIPQPLLKSEAETIANQLNLMNNKGYVVDFQVTTNNRSVDPLMEFRPEHSLKSLYREHYRMAIDPEYTDECSLVNDKVQKFISSNSQDMINANNNQDVLTSLGNYITIEIARPTFSASDVVNLETQKSRELSDKNAETEFDKHILEMLGENTSQIRRIIVTDEQSPNLSTQPWNPDPQTARINDQFSVGFINHISEPLEQFLNNLQISEDNYNTAISKVANNSIHYPLKFADFQKASADQTFNLLKSNDGARITEFIKDFEPIRNNLERSHKNLFNGLRARSTIIGYKIEKRRINPNSVIQTFYVMEPPWNNSNSSPLRFIDTQVHYGSAYNYRIYAIALVFGSMYKYNGSEVDAEEGTATVAVDMRASTNALGHTKIFEVPFYQKVVSLVDLPPLPPEVAFLPDKQDPSSLKIALNHNVGSRVEEPILFGGLDSIIAGNMQNSQNQQGDGLLYYSDSIPEEYQVFMTTKRPSSYYDFVLNYETVATEGKVTVFWETDILLNTDYYFTFRSKEPAGISNPTPVYKLRMVSTPNGNFMILEEYDMQEEREEHKNLSFQKSIVISPATRQKAITYPAGTDFNSRDFALSAPKLEDISIGPQQDAVWDKNYKFRITSKKTGRKIDLNATFNYTMYHNSGFLEIIPPECTPVNPLPITQPEDNCLALGQRRLPKIQAHIRIKEEHECVFGSIETGEKVGRTLRVRWDLDLMDIDGKGTNVFDYFASNPIYLGQGFSSSFTIYQLTGDETADGTPVVDIEEVSFDEYCACSEDEERFANIFTDATMSQLDRAAAGEDYVAIFDTNGHIPIHIENGSPADTTDQEKAEKVKREQTLWWKESDLVASHLRWNDLTDTLPDGDRPDENLINDTLWPSRVVAGARQNGSTGEFLIYDNPQQGWCQNILRNLIKQLTSKRINLSDARGVIRRNPTSPPSDWPFSEDIYRQFIEITNELEASIAENPLENECADIPDNLEPAQLIVTPNVSGVDLSINEGGSGNSGTFSVKLNRKPNVFETPDRTGDSVVVTPSFTPPASPDFITITPASIELTKDNWNSDSNLFTVTSNNTDTQFTGNDRTFDVTFTTSDHPIEELGFNNLSQVRTVEIIENDSPEILVTPTTMTINEGTGANFLVTLSSQPTGNVRIAVTTDPSITNRATINIASFTLNSTNWDTGQTITVQNPEETDIDGNFSFTIKVQVVDNPATTTDTDYLAIAGEAGEKTISVTVLDNDLEQIDVSETPLTIDEGSSTDIGVKLTKEVASGKTVTVNVTNTGVFSGHATFSPTTLTFNDSNGLSPWSTTQNITVNATEENLVDGDFTATIGLEVDKTVSGRDTAYDNAVTRSIDITIVDNDNPGFKVFHGNEEITSDDLVTITVAEGGTAQLDVSLNTALAAGDEVVFNLLDSEGNPVSRTGEHGDEGEKHEFSSRGWRDVFSIVQYPIFPGNGVVAGTKESFSFKSIADDVWTGINEVHEYTLAIDTDRTTVASTYQDLTQTQKLKFVVTEVDIEPCDDENATRNPDTNDCECNEGFTLTENGCVAIADLKCISPGDLSRSFSPENYDVISAIGFEVDDDGEECVIKVSAMSTEIVYNCTGGEAGPNPDNPEVTRRARIQSAPWLALGQAGFRVSKLDAGNYIEQIERILANYDSDFSNFIKRLATGQVTDLTTSVYGAGNYHVQIFGTNQTIALTSYPTENQWKNSEPNCNPCVNELSDDETPVQLVHSGDKCVCPDDTDFAGELPRAGGPVTTPGGQVVSEGKYCNAVAEPEVTVEFFGVLKVGSISFSGVSSVLKLTKSSGDEVFFQHYADNDFPIIVQAPGSFTFKRSQWRNMFEAAENETDALKVEATNWFQHAWRAFRGNQNIRTPIQDAFSSVGETNGLDFMRVNYLFDRGSHMVGGKLFGDPDDPLDRRTGNTYRWQARFSQLISNIIHAPSRLHEPASAFSDAFTAWPKTPLLARIPSQFHKRVHVVPKDMYWSRSGGLMNNASQFWNTYPEQVGSSLNSWTWSTTELNPSSRNPGSRGQNIMTFAFDTETDGTPLRDFKYNFKTTIPGDPIKSRLYMRAGDQANAQEITPIGVSLSFTDSLGLFAGQVLLSNYPGLADPGEARPAAELESFSNWFKSDTIVTDAKATSMQGMQLRGPALIDLEDFTNTSPGNFRAPGGAHPVIMHKRLNRRNLETLMARFWLENF